MNYYNPYQLYPYVAAPVKKGILASLTGGIRGMNWGSILNNTQRTLNIVNQAIPAFKQISPVVKNAKTMFQVMNEFKKVDTPVTTTSPTTDTTKTENVKEKISVENAVQETNQVSTTSGPTFFV